MVLLLATTMPAWLLGVYIFSNAGSIFTLFLLIIEMYPKYKQFFKDIQDSSISSSLSPLLSSDSHPNQLDTEKEETPIDGLQIMVTNSSDNSDVSHYSLLDSIDNNSSFSSVHSLLIWLKNPLKYQFSNQFTGFPIKKHKIYFYFQFLLRASGAWHPQSASWRWKVLHRLFCIVYYSLVAILPFQTEYIANGSANPAYSSRNWLLMILFTPFSIIAVSLYLHQTNAPSTILENIYSPLISSKLPLKRIKSFSIQVEHTLTQTSLLFAFCITAFILPLSIAGVFHHPLSQFESSPFMSAVIYIFLGCVYGVQLIISLFSFLVWPAMLSITAYGQALKIKEFAQMLVLKEFWQANESSLTCSDSAATRTFLHWFQLLHTEVSFLSSHLVVPFCAFLLLIVYILIVWTQFLAFIFYNDVSDITSTLMFLVFNIATLFTVSMLIYSCTMISNQNNNSLHLIYNTFLSSRHSNISEYFSLNFFDRVVKIVKDHPIVVNIGGVPLSQTVVTSVSATFLSLLIALFKIFLEQYAS